MAGKLHVRHMFVKETDGIVSYLEPSMEIVGGVAKVLGTGLLCFIMLCCMLKILTYYTKAMLTLFDLLIVLCTYVRFLLWLVMQCDQTIIKIDKRCVV